MNPEQEIKLLLDKVFDLALKANATSTVYNDGVVVTSAGASDSRPTSSQMVGVSMQGLCSG